MIYLSCGLSPTAEAIVLETIKSQFKSERPYIVGFSFVLEKVALNAGLFYCLISTLHNECYGQHSCDNVCDKNIMCHIEQVGHLYNVYASLMAWWYSTSKKR